MQSRESAAGEVLRRLRRGAAAELRELLGRAAGGCALLRQLRNRGRVRARRRGRRAISGRLHAQASRRKDPHQPQRPRGRAQAGDGALRRRRRLHRAFHPPRPGRPTRRNGRMFPARDGSGPPLRRHRESVHGRRRHGALRCTDRTRRPRGARGGRGLGDPEDDGCLRGRSAPRAGSGVRPAYRPQHRAGGGRQDRRRPAHGLHRTGRDREPSGSPPAGR